METDLWPVQTVGAVILVIGATLIYAAARRQVNTPVAFLAVSAAVALMLVDVVFVGRHIVAKPACWTPLARFSCSPCG